MTRPVLPAHFSPELRFLSDAAKEAANYIRESPLYRAHGCIGVVSHLGSMPVRFWVLSPRGAREVRLASRAGDRAALDVTFV